MEISDSPVASTGMLIRKPPAEVFEAFIDPEITSQFWFSRGSGRLVAGATVQWEWKMYDFTIPVEVKEIEANQRIVIEWPGESGKTTVEWVFEPRGPDKTFVTISNSGFGGDGDSQVRQALVSMEGFALVLAGLKAYLEHGIRLNLVDDRFPKPESN